MLVKILITLGFVFLSCLLIYLEEKRDKRTKKTYDRWNDIENWKKNKNK